jgi:anti-sigma regulatory factor (Ser/Thr protein kinase)
MDGVLAFIQRGLDAAEPVAVAVPSSTGELIGERLDGERSQVEFLDMSELGRNPARIIPGVQALLDKHPEQPLHYVGEPIWAGRSPEEISEATRHEALINLAWPEAPVRVLCPYDVSALDPSVLADAQLTHPEVIDEGEVRQSPAYRERGVPDRCEQPLSDPPGHAVALGFAVGELARLRALVAVNARAAGVAHHRISDLVLAVDELATNAIRYGQGSGILRLWWTTRHFLCQIEDRGQIQDLLAGQRAPAPDFSAGCGLWIVNQLCDLVEVRSTSAGTTIRVHAELS